MQPPTGNQPSLEAWFVQRYGLSRRVEVTTYSFASTPALVVDTERVATVHSRLAIQATHYLPIVTREVPIVMAEMSQVMQWHRYRTCDPSLVWLRSVFLAAVRDMDAAAAVALSA